MSNSDTTNALLTGNDQLASNYSLGRAGSQEGSPLLPRSNTLGEQYTHALFGARVPELAREGSYWTATNTQGTPIVDGNTASFGATTPTLVIVNNSTTGWLHPLRVRLVVVAIGTSSTNVQGRWIIDSTNRYSSGGTQLTPTNPNLQVPVSKTTALVYFGAITATAASGAVRTVNVHQMRVAAPTAGDEYMFEFGSSVPRSVGQVDTAGQFSKVELLPPVALPPGASLLYYQWSASQGAARSFDHIGIEWAERTC